MTTRRELLIMLGAGALAAPLGSFAQQQGKVWRVGFLSARNRPASIDTDYFGAFPRGMHALGYVEGKNLVIEWRFAEGSAERLPGLAAELVRMNVDIIVAGGTQPTSAARKATATIPIVMANIQDPVSSGFVKSLARPGGNITGLSNISSDLSPKHLEMLLGMAPKLSRVAVLMNSANPAHAVVLKNLQAATQSTKRTIVPLEARTAQEIVSAFSTMAQQNAGAVVVPIDALFIDQTRRIAELALKNRMASISSIPEYAEAGGLMSYGQSFGDNYGRTATYVDKIFKGAKPADLPVEQPTIFELVINGKTAKALGLAIPSALMISANKVIE